MSPVLLQLRQREDRGAWWRHTFFPRRNGPKPPRCFGATSSHRDAVTPTRSSEGHLTKLKAALTGAGDAERREIKRLMSEMSALSPQLYVEYGCRLLLAWRTIRLAVLHFAERYPATLGRFCWVLDDKPSNLKALYRSSIPGFIQQLAEDEPLELLGHANHRHLARFLIPADVLKGSQRAWAHAHQRTYDAARMMTAEVSFVDSTSSSGVQIADLIVGGLRACLRGEFSDNQRAAELLGSLFYDKEGMAQVVPLTYFTATDQGEPPVDDVAMSAVAAMGLRARRLRILG